MRKLVGLLLQSENVGQNVRKLKASRRGQVMRDAG